MKRKKLAIYLSMPFLLGLIAIIVANLMVILTPTERIADVKKLPQHQPCLVLGTSKYLKKGGINAFYADRMEAAAMAFKFHKCANFVLSGNGRYGETKRMRLTLMRLGVPETVIQQDQKGYRTIDSIRNFKTIYGYHRGIVISQGFHNQRALYLAKLEHLSLIGFDAPKIKPYFGFFTQVREVFARARAVWDVYFTRFTFRVK